MQKLYFFTLVNSPYCIRTQQRLIAVMVRSSKYRKVPIEIVDVLERPAFVEQFKLEKYPAFCIGKNCIGSGEMEEKELIRILEKCLSD